eukprot:TRINITY_DN26031_c0_g1_i1.p1 TRINITY_DN26031_c0_g1~~TRINITY_DN26031_c0_g1_i1.p1  ORF type:complete len:122 (-),score=6.34 TRINITY_DN26031_c0_g1_i1:137-502(-)
MVNIDTSSCIFHTTNMDCLPLETKWSEIEDRAVFRQWKELESCSEPLSKINSYLSDRTYFGGDFKTATDDLAYDSLRTTMEKLSFMDKEKYINVSRWYSHIQSSRKCEKNPVLFSKTRLYA